MFARRAETNSGDADRGGVRRSSIID